MSTQETTCTDIADAILGVTYGELVNVGDVMFAMLSDKEVWDFKSGNDVAAFLWAWAEAENDPA